MKQEIINKVKAFVEAEERSCTPVMLTAENIAHLCYVSVDDAREALKELGR